VSSVVVASRPVLLSREHNFFRLVFSYDPVLVDRVKRLPYSIWEPKTKSWLVRVSTDAVEQLRAWFYDGLLDVSPDTLVLADEQIPVLAAAVLQSGTNKRPFKVLLGVRDDKLFNRLNSVPGAVWQNRSGGFSYPVSAASGLAELVDKQVVSDPERLLTPAEVTVMFDAQTGRFKLRGDSRAQQAWDHYWPLRDVVGEWRQKGLDVGFVDDFTAEVYNGELARHRGVELQPAGLVMPLYEYQRKDLAVIVERTGFSVLHKMGVGKCVAPETMVSTRNGAVPIASLWEMVDPGSLVVEPDGVWGLLQQPVFVKAWDNNGGLVTRKVLRVWKQPIDSVLRVIHTRSGKQIETTTSHKLLRDSGWTAQVGVGDKIATVSGEPFNSTAQVFFDTVTKVVFVPYQGFVYDLEVDQNHSFVANNVVCHNTALGIAAAQEVMVNRGDVSRALFIVPSNLRSQWKHEILRFTGMDPKEVVVIEGATKKKRLETYDLAEQSRWVVASYDVTILPDDKKRLRKLVQGSYLIADEAHRLKSHTAARSKVMADFAQRASRRLALSGTPAENTPNEWFNIFSVFAIPGLFGSPTDFLSRYSYPGEYGGFYGAQRIEELRDRSFPHYVRRSLEDVAEHLPPMRIEIQYLDPTKEYAAVLRRAHSEARKELAAKRYETLTDDQQLLLNGENQVDVESGVDMTAVGMLKLLCCSPRLLLESDAPSAKALVEAGIVPDVDGPKIEELRSMVRQVADVNERVVVFSSLKRMANLVAKRLEEDGISYVLYTGDTPQKERDLAVERFTSPGTDTDPGPTVFIATDAGAEGLNLGRMCSTVINLDIPWTPGRLAQRNARVRRVDSESKGFQVINLVVLGTIEQGFLQMIENKADLADALFGETTGRANLTGRANKPNRYINTALDWLSNNETAV